MINKAEAMKDEDAKKRVITIYHHIYLFIYSFIYLFIRKW